MVYSLLYSVLHGGTRWHCGTWHGGAVSTLTDCIRRCTHHMALALAAAAALMATTLGHTDLTMLPCNAADPQMLWELPAPSLQHGKAGQIIHQPTKLCLMSAGCKVATGIKGALVLDDCHAPCLSGHHVGQLNVDQWTVGNDPKQPLAIVSSTLHNYVIDASSSRWAGDAPLVMEPWDTKFFTNQQWTVGPAQGGGPLPGHTLTVGKGAGTGGYLPDCPVEPCCMSAHHDIVPDGDSGWGIIVFLLLALGLYAGGGVAYGKRRDLPKGSPQRGLKQAAYHPHYHKMMHVVGLCRDGVQFSRGFLQPSGGIRRQQHTANAGPLQEPLAPDMPPKTGDLGGKVKLGKHAKTKRDSKKERRHGESRGRAPESPAEGTVAGGGGRWVHVPS